MLRKIRRPRQCLGTFLAAWSDSRRTRDPGNPLGRVGADSSGQDVDRHARCTLSDSGDDLAARRLRIEPALPRDHGVRAGHAPVEIGQVEDDLDPAAQVGSEEREEPESQTASGSRAGHGRGVDPEVALHDGR